ncbi:MAG: AAA family ATPase [Armatimonadota bacterium]
MSSEHDVWQGAMWQGLVKWWEGDPKMQRAAILRRAARRNIRGLLARGNLADLTLERFRREVGEFGALTWRNGDVVGPEQAEGLDPGRLRRMLAAGELRVTGNQCIESPIQICPQLLPGLDGLHLDELRGFLSRLLHGQADEAHELVDRAARGEAPLGGGCASMILCMCSARPYAIWTPGRMAGLRRLALLTGWHAGVAEAHEGYRHFSELAVRLRDASGGALGDLLAVDVLLCALAELREPAAWKIAVGHTVPESEADVIARDCLQRGYVAIAPDDPDDPNIAGLRRVVPGDCVAMHLRGRIGAVGRVTRPFYEVRGAPGGPPDFCWRWRLDVEWLAGDRDYGSLLTGAQQRYSVVEIGWETFWAIAAMYRHSPEYDRLFRPLRGAWAFLCEPDRWQTLSQLPRPLPLRDQWEVQIEEDTPAPGDVVLVCRDGQAPAIIAVARVIAQPQAATRQGCGAARIDLLYEQVLDEPLALETLRRDPRMASWRPPEDTVARRLSVEQTAAVCEMLRLPPESHFLMFADGRDEPALRPQTSYRLSERVAGQPQRMVAAIDEGTVRCLVYHGAPEHTFTGFGGVVALTAHEGAPAAEDSLEVLLDLCRFPRRTGAMPGVRALARSSARHRHTGHIRTVLPVSVHDFYRVVGAGMGATGRSVKALTIDELARACGAPAGILVQIERMLRERGQMIFYGPPGTGKTFVALRMAHYLADGDESRCALVQFHPSYSYEDFIEGIRPRTVDLNDGRTELTYPIVPGAFASFCERARRDPHNTYVFVIDELNRAHVASVFGELMLALEYRDRQVGLAHSAPEAAAEGAEGGFSVPRNVLVLATMNTADRSTALVDYALRRRFVFYPFFPGDGRFVEAMFRSWLSANAPHMAWVAELLAILNGRLEPELGRHLLIGHTYFLRPGLTEESLREIWRFQLLPLLEEYFAGMPERLAQFDLDELIRQAQAVAARRSAQEGEQADLRARVPVALRPER